MDEEDDVPEACDDGNHDLDPEEEEESEAAQRLQSTDLDKVATYTETQYFKGLSEAEQLSYEEVILDLLAAKQEKKEDEVQERVIEDAAKGDINIRVLIAVLVAPFMPWNSEYLPRMDKESMAEADATMIVAALYPPALTDPNVPWNNATGRAIRRHFPGNFLFADICPLAPPRGENRNVRQDLLHKLCTATCFREVFAEHYRQEIQYHLEGSPKARVVYVSGRTAQAVFDVAQDSHFPVLDPEDGASIAFPDHPFLKNILQRSSAGESLGKTRWFFSLERRHHVSYHLMKGCEKDVTATFHSDMNVCSSLATLPADYQQHLSHKQLQDLGGKLEQHITELDQERIEGQKRALDYFKRDDWQKDLQHLEWFPFHRSSVKKNLEEATRRLGGKPGVLLNSLMRMPGFRTRLTTPGYVATLIDWAEGILGTKDPDLLLSVITNGMCVWVEKPAWRKTVSMEFFKQLGMEKRPDLIARFMSGSVAAACDNPKFTQFLEALVDPAGDFRMSTQQLVTFMCNSVAARWDKPEFLNFLEDLMDPAGPFKMSMEQLVTFMSGSVAKRSDKPEFLNFLKALMDPAGPFKMSMEQLFEFVSGSVAVASDKPGFTDFLTWLVGDSGAGLSKDICHKGYFASFVSARGVEHAKDVVEKMKKGLGVKITEYFLSNQVACSRLQYDVHVHLIKICALLEVREIPTEVITTLFGSCRIMYDHAPSFYEDLVDLDTKDDVEAFLKQFDGWKKTAAASHLYYDCKKISQK